MLTRRFSLPQRALISGYSLTAWGGTRASVSPFKHKEAMTPRVPGEWMPVSLNGGTSASLSSAWHTKT